jgi:hypothetical protein
MNKILKDLLHSIIDGLYGHPLAIKAKVHILHISPYIEQEDKDKNKDWVQKPVPLTTLSRGRLTMPGQT